MHSSRDSSGWISGAHNVICDICGRKLKSHEVVKTWDGLIVCPDDFDEKHASLLPRPKFPHEGRSVRDARIEPVTDASIYSELTWDEILTAWRQAEFKWNTGTIHAVVNSNQMGRFTPNTTSL